MTQALGAQLDTFPWSSLLRGLSLRLPNLQPFASLLDAQPPEVQEASQFLLATAMHEVGKFDLQLVVSRKGTAQ